MRELAKPESSLTRKPGAISARICLAVYVAFVALPVTAQASFSPCDLNQDGVVNAADVQSVIDMTLRSVPCTANIGGANVCNVAIVQRVIDAALGGACVTGTGAVPHSVSLGWTASTSSDVVGYYLFRGPTSGGPYTMLNSSLIAATAFTDNTVASGQTYYYVSTAVDNSNNQSTYSNEASATVPSP